ncbi:hypothetical protein AXG93_2515s1240 [Marchantia polymorpha subsp. ruderalis]|uniref:Ribosomal RNA methyltransferase FtsJ domain-containing protein n=1 Tax=Marchantia polymorpha subsp. ruderalis TaxID=1480154 RepID=A0A176W7R6_MARPO|nr:hypothetical protein AXG93_2515s1240 [Marchantia polymorpha subsp. ruderalis]
MALHHSSTVQLPRQVARLLRWSHGKYSSWVSVRDAGFADSNLRRLGLRRPPAPCLLNPGLVSENSVAARCYAGEAEPSVEPRVTVDGKPAAKAGAPVLTTSNIIIDAEIPKFVCRAGYKLEAALEHFKCDIQGKVALDAGLSTGGFTDCLLQYGASFVYGVDVGYGQVAEKIRREERVCVMERTNLRYLADLPQLVDIVTLDLAFISILLVMPAVLAAMKPEATLIALIKPQFEARKSQVGSGGVVRDPEVHKEVVARVVHGVEACGFKCEGWIQSPLKGAEGNIEFLACFTRLPVEAPSVTPAPEQI